MLGALRGLGRLLWLLLRGLVWVLWLLLRGLVWVLAELLGDDRAGEKPVYGYSFRGWDGQTRYVGITNNPRRRQAQHSRAGKRGRLTVETGAMSRQQARRWETGRLADHRHRHGQNPRYNKTDTGGRWS